MSLSSRLKGLVNGNTVALLLLIAFLAIIPLTGHRFYMYIATLIMIMGMFAMGYNVLFGYVGLLSFGHGLFFGAGAYSTALFTLKVYSDPLVGVLITVPVALLTSIIVGVLTLKHGKVYFAILTLALSMIFWSALVKLRWLTGGTDGLVGIPKRGVFVDVSGPIVTYYFILAFFAVIMLGLYILNKSRYGLLLRALGANEDRLPFLGYSTFTLRMVALTISGTASALAGSLYAVFYSVVTPDVAYWTFGAEPLIMTLIGGPSYFLGPLIGALIFVPLTTVVARFAEYWMLLLGIALLAVILFFRGGLLGFLESLSRELKLGVYRRWRF
ncbi:MAG: branched-chain amino acid ABC transporter permease [Thermoprotei archaeon]|nr:branched-chain amino acid ABC transporter permease [Thermoprotei archaeon]